VWPAYDDYALRISLCAVQDGKASGAQVGSRISSELFERCIHEGILAGGCLAPDNHGCGEAVLQSARKQFGCEAHVQGTL
jgi:hypothetical protein